MQAAAVSRLLDINRQFYQTFAASFSVTRRRLQPGVLQILSRIGPGARILDLGCGNGELASALVRRGWEGAYLGVDFSPSLLEEARMAAGRIPGGEGQVEFLQWDLSRPDGLSRQVESLQPVDAVFAFAVLHHLPGRETREALLREVRAILRSSTKAGAVFIHSEWRFLASPRLAARCLPWERAGMTSAEVDPGDYLLDWRRGGTGLRYVHHFSEEELADLAAASGFHVGETFYSDGENGRLGLYQRWSCLP